MVNENLVIEKIVEAFNTTKTKQFEDNKKKSRALIKGISERFIELYPENRNFLVFSKELEEKRKEFGLKELLFDILVCKSNIVKSEVRKKDILYIEDALVIIESELAEDLRAVANDFSKLVIGRAPIKIMILPKGKKENNYLKPLKTIAASIVDEKIYCICIPTPEKWNEDSEADVYQFKDNNWEKVAQ